MPRESGWIYKRSWDLTLIIGSAILVPMPFLVAAGAQATGWLSQSQAIDLVNIMVAALIGGPHLFSTVTYTFLDGKFRARHPWYSSLALLLPVGVVLLGVYQYRLLVTLFFTWASLHVLHQIIYLSDCYRRRAPGGEAVWSRVVDYGVILTGLYPVGIYKISRGAFHVGGVLLPFPDFLRPLRLDLAAGAVFAAFLAVWIWKTLAELRERRGSLPKTLLIGVTTVVSFCLPFGSNMDVLFQGYNTWHSFQYLFLLWMINRLRDERGEVQNGFVQGLVRRGSMLAYYSVFAAATGLMVLVTVAVRRWTTLSPDQSYFMVVLSVLLMHYYFDHFLFSQPELLE